MVNKAILIGNVGRDPEVKYTQSGSAVCNFTVATTEKWKDKGGEKKEKTEWHNLVAWGKLGEICGEYLAKGRQVYIEGKLQTRKWEKDGVTRYATEVVVTDMKMLGRQQDGGSVHSDMPKQSRIDEGMPPDYDSGEIPF